MNTTAAVTTGHVTAVLRLPDGADPTAAARAARMLPGGWHLGPAAGPVLLDITSGPCSVSADDHAIRLSLPARQLRTDTLAYVTYTALERLRQQQHRVSVHANAAVAPDGRAVLLLGSKGTGKTTTTLALGELGWTHAGDDLVVLAEDADGTLSVLPGKPTAAVRPADPALHHLPKPIVDLAPFADRPTPLALIVRLGVHPAAGSGRLLAATPFSVNERLRLHEMLARYISGLPTPLTGVSGTPYGPVWPIDTPDCARWRSHLLDRLERTPYLYLQAAGARAAAELIAREYNR
ncbi:hypothetical protein [Streptomyces sp. NRRL S-350]|uniref:hypothetical protein n=1 Tax=Streptomyces sp. NRRL S-350 TaxID=1463902 RepID=UPI0004C08687|nr:hypothetical protein [Streptomyces sp. NRRL S-350]